MKKTILFGGFLIATLTSFSQKNNALSFDGVDDQVAMVNHPLDDATNFTIEAQVKNEASNADNDVFLQFYDATDTRFEVRINSGKLAIYSQVLNTEPSSTFTVPVGSFFHMALVKNGQITKLYANGNEVLTLNGNYSLGSSLRIGRYFVDNTFSFKGQIDELRMWNVARTIEQIKATPTCALSGNEADLVGYWDFNHGVAEENNAGIIILEDKSSGAVDGELMNFALTGASSNWVASRVICAVTQNNALSFDGVDDQVAIVDQPLKDATNFTIEALVKNEATNPDNDVFLQFYDVTDTRFEVRINSGKLAIYSQVLNTEPSSTFPVPVGKFFHMALVKNGQITKLYANGDEVLTLNGNYSLGSILRIGRYFIDNTFSFKGQMDELRMWNVALTSTQIKGGSVCALKSDEVNLVGHWDFNHGIPSGSNAGVISLNDKSGSAVNGTLSNFTLSGTSSNWVESNACEEVITGTQETEYASAIRVFPSPASNWIEIQGAENNSVVEIYSATGQLILSQELTGRISLPSTLDAGMYIVNVKGTKVSKHVFIKQ